MLQFERHVEQTDAIQGYYGRWSWGKGPSRLGNFWKKITTLTSSELHFGKDKVADIKNLLEILKLFSPFSPLYLQIKFKPRLNVRSQTFVMRSYVGCLGADPPKAIGGMGA